MSETDLVRAASQLAAALTPGDLDHTLNQVTAAAVELLPEVDFASLTVRHADGRLEIVAPTDHLVTEVDQAQYELREGPCYDTATDEVHIVAPDIATDVRYPQYGPVAAKAGIGSQIGIRLFDTGKAHGALNLYSRRVGVLASLEPVHALFAHQSAMAIEYAREIDDLHKALETRKVIGQAVGIVMNRYELNEQRAFAFLVRLSSRQNVKLHRLAQEFVLASEERAG
jgi:hypothetical protein